MHGVPRNWERTYKGMTCFCAIMNMPVPLDAKPVTNHNEALQDATVDNPFRPKY